MTELTIGRLAAEVVAPDRTDPDRVDRLLRRLADRTLDERRAGMHRLSGHWCVRRLDLEISLDAGEPDAAAAQRWADLIATSVRGLAADGTSVVHYAHRGSALADLVRSIPAGRVERVWAWRQLGLIAAHDPDPLTDTAAALLAAVGREPDLTVAAVVHAVRAGGIGPLDRALGEAGWTALARIVAPDLPLGPEPLPAPQWPAGRAHRHERVGPEGGSPPRPAATLTEVAAAERARARDVLAGSMLIAAALAGAPAPSAPTLAAWAVLGTAEVEPSRPALAAAVAGALRSAHRTRSVTTARRRDEPAPRTSVPAPPSSGRPVGLGELAARSEPRRAAPAAALDDPACPLPAPAERGADPAAHPATERDADLDLDPDLDGRPAADTAWAGLLFLLNTAGAADVPDALDADLRLASRPLGWTMHQIAQRLVPVAATNPAALAMAGLGPDAPAPVGDDPTGSEEAALAEHAAHWAARTAAAAARAAEPADGAPPTVWSLARRPGRIVADPGWMEVHLALDDVDMTVRRAGLDVDPGWLGWLGTVVRFCYE